MPSGVETVTFLLGAGASVPAGIPHVRAFYSEFRNHIGKTFGPAHDLPIAFDALEAAWQKRVGRPLDDLERLYETLTFVNSTTRQAIPLGLPDGFPSRSRELELLHWELKKYVQERCLGAQPSKLAYLEPLTRFVSLSRPLTVLSLNYDACVELVMDRAGVRWTDGAPDGNGDFFASDLRFSEDTPVHLVKLHGSVTWYEIKSESCPGWMRRVRATAPGQSAVSRLLGEARTLTHEAMMVYPTLGKALANGPFPALAAQAARALHRSRLCVAVGYAFADTHIQRLLIEALSANPELRLVIVNPAAEEILHSLYRVAPIAFHSRIGAASAEEEAGYVENALKGDRLYGCATEWLSGAPLHMPFAALRGKQPSPHFKESRQWRLKYPVDGTLRGLARGDGVLYVARKDASDVLEISLADGSIRTLVTRVRAPWGLAFDRSSETLYLVSNQHGKGRIKLPWERGGVGQLWAIDVRSGTKRALTKVGLVGAFVAYWLRRGARDYWKQLPGALRWPTSVVVEKPGESVLFTEARAIRRLDLRTRRLSTAVRVPLPFNIVGLSLEAPGRLLVADAGVHPDGFGRLLRAELATGQVEMIAGGWGYVGNLAYLPVAKAALVAQGLRWPRGEVFSVGLGAADRAPDRRWQGLDAPFQFALGEDDTEVLVSTQTGIVSLAL